MTFHRHADTVASRNPEGQGFPVAWRTDACDCHEGYGTSVTGAWNCATSSGEFRSVGAEYQGRRDDRQT